MHITTSRRGGTLLAMLTGLLLMVLAGAPAAHACSCMGWDFDEAVEQADLIAEVTVQHEIADDQGDVTYYVAVERVWKGEESRAVELTTHEQTTACGLGRIPDGETLTVWAQGEAGEYRTNWCMLPMDGGSPAELDDALGPATDLSDQPIPASERAPVLPWTTLAVVAGAGVALYALAVGAAVLVTVLVVRARRRS